MQLITSGTQLYGGEQQQGLPPPRLSVLCMPVSAGRDSWDVAARYSSSTIKPVE
jgi:hypothetical protein